MVMRRFRRLVVVVAAGFALGVIPGFSAMRAADNPAPRQNQGRQETPPTASEGCQQALERRDWKYLFSNLSSSAQDNAVADELLTIALLGDGELNKIADKYVDWQKVDHATTRPADTKPMRISRQHRLASCVTDKAMFFEKMSPHLEDRGLLPKIVPACSDRAPSQSQGKMVATADTVVRRSDFDMPNDRDTARGCLWSTFANRPDAEKFSSVTSNDWEATFKQYRESLVEKARAHSLDSQSLDDCLSKVLKDSEGADKRRPWLAYLPVGAYLARQGITPVWIVVVKWKDVYPVAPNGNGVLQSFGHVRVFGYDAKSLKLIGFCTCD